MGQHAVAEKLYKEALLGYERHFCRTSQAHPTTLSILGNLALQYKTQRRYDESEELYRRVLQEKETSLGPSHPSTLPAPVALRVV